MGSELIPVPKTDQGVQRLTDFQTRFLLPFFFERRGVTKALAALQAETFSTRDGKSFPLWECAEAHHLYKDELLDHVVQFLFGTRKDAGCGFLRVADVAANAWFAQTEIVLANGKRLPLRLVPGPRIELFVSPQGVGVLSMAFTPELHDLAQEDALEFNYHLAQFQRRIACRIRKRHPRDNPEVWQKMAAEQQQRIPPAPADDTALADRLGAPGGNFAMAELIAYLLKGLSEADCEPIQAELSVYTVARFGPKVDFGDAARRTELAPFLSALSQVEESTHAIPPADQLGVPNVILNSRHWSATGLLGAAHLVADQGEVEFDKQKLGIVRDKYFIPFLLVLMQRTALNRGIKEAGSILAQPADSAPDALAHLRDDMLRFAVEGHFTQVSSRHVLHRFYQLVREGMDVSASWEEVRRAIADLDARFTAERESRMTLDMAKNLGIVTRVQLIVEFMEIFIVSVYFAHLWHMFAHQNQLLEEWLPGKSLHWVVHGGVFVAALLGGFIAFLIVRPGKHHGAGQEPNKRTEP
ncbi:MAG TPA: hypothetical protein VGZ47_21500 [Gemmataceae bacterium]|nr:hypothetical protein [Gemmataceae bacterium]